MVNTEKGIFALSMHDVLILTGYAAVLSVSYLYKRRYAVDLEALSIFEGFLTMKAVRVLQFGGPEVLKVLEIPIPKPQRKQVLVNIKAAGINPVDTYIRSGVYSAVPNLPYTPGKDGAGIVHEAGDAVTQFKAGDRVWFGSNLTGAYAEYAVCEEKFLRKLPDKVSFEQGAALGIPYITAHRALFHKCKAKAGDSVLIHGASGGVGIAAVQLAVAHGMTVLGTVGSDDGAALLKSMAIHKIFNHRKDGYVNEIIEATQGKGMDIILEMLANVNLANDLKILGTLGRVAAAVNSLNQLNTDEAIIKVIGCRGPIEINPRDTMGKELSIFGVAMLKSSEEEMQASYSAVQTILEAGQLNPIVGLKYPLEECHLAHKEIIETKAARGKMVLLTSKI